MGQLHVRVQPGARRTGFVGWFGDLPRLAVAARPVDGAANVAAIAAVAELCGVPRRQVHLVGGAAARTKRFRVDGIDDTEIAERLARLIPR